MTTINSYNILSYDELSNILDNQTEDSNYKTAAGFLNEALTDWPTENLQEPIDLIVELKKEVQNKLTFSNLDNYNKGLNAGDNAWKMCALSSLLELFDFDRRSNFDTSVELEDIISKISNHYYKS
jgi:hypothetical protein